MDTNKIYNLLNQINEYNNKRKYEDNKEEDTNKKVKCYKEEIIIDTYEDLLKRISQTKNSDSNINIKNNNINNNSSIKNSNNCTYEKCSKSKKVHASKNCWYLYPDKAPISWILYNIKKIDTDILKNYKYLIGKELHNRK